MIFIEETHQYLEEEEEYTSMTTFIERYKQKSDWRKIARAYAVKNGYDEDYWLNKWDENRRLSATLGSKVHLVKERECYEEDWDYIHSWGEGPKQGLDLKNLKEGLYPELLLYDHRYKLAGQADRVEYRNGLIHIKDYKTSKEIKTDPVIYFSKEQKRKIRKRLLPPVSHLDDNNYTIYSLQLSGYAFILERYGYKIGSLQLIHLKLKGREKENFYKEALETGFEIEDEIVYEVPYRRKEIQMMFIHHLKGLKIGL